MRIQKSYWRQPKIIYPFRNYGKGIPEEDLKRVTEAFYMVDKSRSRVKGSVGLGLALCQKIADIHGFQLEITSHLGKGTIISVLW